MPIVGGWIGGQDLSGASNYLVLSNDVVSHVKQKLLFTNRNPLYGKG